MGLNLKKSDLVERLRARYPVLLFSDVRASTAFALLALSLPIFVGCGLTSESHSIVWTASLDTMPDATCVRGAIASVREISGIDAKTRPGGYFFGARLEGGNVSGPDIYIVVTREGHDPVQFRMEYGDYQIGGGLRESTANVIVSKLSAACGIPELARRVQEKHESEWHPYFW